MKERQQLLVKVSPALDLYVYDEKDALWYVWSPNGEYFDGDYEDGLTTQRIKNWQGATFE